MLEFLRFELRYQLRHSVLWLSCVAFLLLGFGSSVSPAFIFARMFGASHVNAPATVVLFMGIFTMLALVPTIAFAAEPVLRDFQTGMAEILYAMPVKKRQYILGRLAAGVVTTTVPFLCAILGSVLGATMPWLDPSVVGPVTVTPYIWGFLVIVLPNVLAIIAVDVSLATKTKSMGGVFVGVFAFFIFWIIAGVVALGANQQVATLIDPFGTRAFSLAVRDLKPGDINTLLPALTGQLLTNRVVWLVISSSLIVWSLISFDRVKIATSIRRRELARQADAKHRVSRAVTAVFDTLLKGVPAPLVRPTAQLLELSALKYGQAITSWAFMAVLALALTALAAGASQIGSATTVHPVTYWMLSDLKQVMGAAGIVIAVFAAGELAFRDREVRINELVDTMPVPHGIRVAANIGVLTLLTLTAFTGAVVLLIGLQIADGTVVVDLSTWLLGTTVVIVPIFCYGLIALALQMVVKTRIVGYVAFAALALLAYLGSLSSALDFVVSFVLPPNLRYSDLNGYGAPLLTFWIVTARLGAVTALAIALTWPRQAPTGIGAKHGGSGQRRARILSITVLTLVVVGLSGVLSPLAGYHTAGQDAQADLDRRADYEREHRSLLGAPQPVVSSVSTVVQIFPASRRATLSGSYTVENHTDQIISAIHFRLDPRAKYMLEVQGEPQIGAQDAMFVIANLRKPLQPGESRILSFHVDVVSPRLANDGYTDPVLRNGTLIPAFSVLPQFGYDSQGEIVDPETRARMHLGDRPMSASPNQSMLGPNVSWLSKFETTISTSDDQEAVAPGNLKKEWHEGGRHYFQYAAEGPVLPFGGFMSGRWSKASSTTGTVTTSVYSDPAHRFNVDQMNKTMGATLGYLDAQIAPYPYTELRLVEFPRYAVFAESFPGMVPYGESLGFIGNLDAPGSVDYVSYIAAHEVAHQWWGQRMLGSHEPGAAMLTESLAQYSALMVMKQIHGEAALRPYLRNELQSYLALRKSIVGKEPSLAQTDGERFLSYNKGALVFYRISQEIGEQNLNEILRAFFAAHEGKGPPFPAARDLAESILASTPDDKRAVVGQLLNQVVVYDNTIESAVATHRSDGKWDVEIRLRAGKLRQFVNGRYEVVPYAEPVKVSAVEQTSEHEGDDKEIATVSQIPDGSDMTVRMTTRTRPDKAVIDFKGKLIDLRPSAESRAMSYR